MKNNLKILLEKGAPASYKVAAAVFQKLYKAVCNIKLDVIHEDDKKSDLIVIGAANVNIFVYNMLQEKVIKNLDLCYGSDGFHILSGKKKKRNFLFLCGGRGRATLYAVYHFFETRANCRYFWDGDIIPQTTPPDITGIDIAENPRLEYRGIRYFAHRSLHRFQAEHWSFEDWQKEIDYIIKKKLNLFMLRIGIDDIFQKAFPDKVAYPPIDGKLEGTGKDSYNDRSLFWSLEFRGKLRKKILNYAFERDLIHPEDIGTPTHWYSSTPVDFLKNVKPELLTQDTETYSEQVNSVFDIRKKCNFNYYMKLTQTHIKEYGKAELFHTIGLAERSFYKDKESNSKLKYFVYQQLISFLKENYPNAPLLLSSWDFWNQPWTKKEVQNMLGQLNPNQAIIFDYTSDTGDESNFTNWAVLNKFPWIAGIFHAYESTTDILGNYDLIKERLKLAFADNFCKGLVFWSETVHTDVFMLEYFTESSWRAEAFRAEDLLEKFCNDRYANNSSTMLEVWQNFFPILKTKSWDLNSPGYYNLDLIDGLPEYRYEAYKKFYNNMLPLYYKSSAILKNLSMIDYKNDEFVIRDTIDIAKSVVLRCFIMVIMEIKDAKLAHKENKTCDLPRLKNNAEILLELIDCLGDLLGVNDEYSLFYSLQKMKDVTDVNKHFESTLKANAFNYYCRTMIYEIFKFLQIDDLKVYLKSSFSYLQDKGELKNIAELYAKNIDNFKQKPLAEMAPPMNIDRLPKILTKLSQLISDLKFDKLYIGLSTEKIPKRNQVI